MNSNSLIAIIAAVCCTGLGLAVWVRKPYSLASLCFFIGMLVLTADNAIAALSFQVSNPEKLRFWASLDLIETAAGGTLFLDEIGDLRSSLQDRLLRFLREQRIQRVGCRRAIQIETRVIAATNADLKEAIAEEKFRELQNRAKRAVIMADNKRLTEKDLGLGDVVKGSSASTLKQARESVERELIQNTLKKHLGRISSAAAELGISRPTLYELMEKLGIKKAGAIVQSSSTQG